MTRFILSAAAAIALAGVAQAAPVQLTPGQWQADLSMTAMGQTMSDGFSDCMLESEANMEPTELAAEIAGGANCSPSNVKQSSGQISFDLTCSGTGMTAASMVMTHSPTSFTMEGDITLTFDDGSSAPGTLTVNAYRTGVCTNPGN